MTALVGDWDMFEQPCGERLAAVLRSETDRLYVMTSRFSASVQQHEHGFGDVRERDRDELFGEVTLRGSNGRHTWVAGSAAERDA